MKHVDYFKTFLEDVVNLNATRLTRLNDHVDAITTFLEDSPEFQGSFISVIPQGSYAHKTIIKPVQDNDEFDADLLLELEEIDGWAAKDYVEELYKCFRASAIYKDKVSRKTRCVEIDYAGDFHIDVVPFLERNGYKYVTNRHADAFELSNPEGYNAWLYDKSRMTSGNLIKVLRLLKYLRDYKGTFSIKSFVLNVLVGERISDAELWGNDKAYIDVPTTLRTVMNRLKEYLEPLPNMPSIMDPSETGENLGDRWNQEGYASFRNSMLKYADWIDDAWSETDRTESLKKWQKIFGDSFGVSSAKSSETSLSRVAGSLPNFTNTEENITSDLGIPVMLDGRYVCRIDATLYQRKGFRSGKLSSGGNKVFKGSKMRFEIGRCTVPEPYEIYWKVLNRGEEAIARDCVRGQIVLGGKVWKQTEPAAFAGPHIVEVYIVKEGVCVAKDRHDVTIL